MIPLSLRRFISTRRNLTAVAVATAVAALALPAISCAAETRSYLTQVRPVAAEEIKIGICNPTSGRQGDRGKQMVRGVEALVAQVNATDGIFGRKLRVVTYDDHYESLYTLVGTQKLINEDKVFALCSYVGTASAVAVTPMLAEATMPLIGISSGADSLRTNKTPYLFNVRPSYAQEIESLVNHLVNNAGVKKIAVLYQMDGFGDSVLRSVEKTLREHNLSLAGKAGYVRNTVDLEDAVDQLAAVQPDAVIMAAVFQPAAAFMRAALTRKDFHPLYCAISPVSTEEFITAAGAAADGVLVSQVFASPNDAQNPLIAEYQAAMRALGETTFTYSSLEGYLNARVLAEGLRAAGKDLTTEKFIAALESLQLDFGGQPCVFGPGNHQGLREIYLTKISGGQVRPVTPLDAAASAGPKTASANPQK